MLFETIKDVVSHTQPFFEAVKLSNKTGTTKIECVSKTNSIIMLANLKRNITNFDNDIGFNRLPTLSGILKYPNFDGNSASLITEERDGVKVATELQFRSKDKHNAKYRLMSTTAINKVVPDIPPFNGATWEISFIPSVNVVNDLNYFNTILKSSGDLLFSARVDCGTLIFDIGDDDNKMELPIGQVTGLVKKVSHWRLSDLLTILKLVSATSPPTVNLTGNGLIQITSDTPFAEYTYFIIAQRRAK